jgi:hypothetical protein
MIIFTLFHLNFAYKDFILSYKLFKVDRETKRLIFFIPTVFSLCIIKFIIVFARFIVF